MAGDIFAKEGTVTTVTSSGGSATNGSAVSAGDVDIRSGGTTNLIQQLLLMAELTCQWATVTNIIAGTLVADLYLVPKVDGTNAVDIDTQAGSSYIAPQYRAGYFAAAKTPTANTNALFASREFDVFPGKYTVYIINRSGQTISANWTLKLASTRAQYN